ncbi:hypothetical protein E2562_014074 [Oryza meyeriana var. granulata]|uniref:Uncharacterized protein n=1 Tax=Oryza meyeriana var. granulata TaxID=110450 RepID=A0A6G1DL65_9ORYZ|nr:hypothetical protein E2562_014074 [Oryza meyeriana var. granulata]
MVVRRPPTTSRSGEDPGKPTRKGIRTNSEVAALPEPAVSITTGRLCAETFQEQGEGCEWRSTERGEHPGAGGAQTGESSSLNMTRGGVPASTCNFAYKPFD